MTFRDHALPDDASPSGQRSAGITGLFFLVAFSVFRMPPWLPLFAIESNGVDPSWQMLLNEAVSQNWVFGRDLLFTYGPFGFIHARMYHPETWPILIVTWMVMAVIMADLVWRVTGLQPISLTARTLCGMALIEFMSRDAMAICFGLHTLIYLEAISIPKKDEADHQQHASTAVSVARGIRHTLPVLMLAALPWAKFSYFVTVLLLGGALSVVAVLQRRIPWRVIFLSLACPLAWVINGGTLAECREFVMAGLQLAGGYSAAMGLGPQSWAGVTVVVSAGGVVLLLPVWLAARIPLTDWRQQLLTMLFFHGLLFITWKSCFVRFHAERIPVFLGTVLPLILIGWLADRSRELERFRIAGLSNLIGAIQRRIIFPALLATLLVAVASGTVVRLQPLTLNAAINHAVTPMREQWLAVIHSVKEPGWRRRTHESQLEKIRDANPIPEIDGTVDVFPSKLIVAFAHGLPLKPRPVLQSYAAFTPELIRRDTAHFTESDAPDYVLISVGGIDGRLATLEDSQAWLELLSNYEISDQHKHSSEMVLLRRTTRIADSGIAVAAEPEWRCTAEWGETIHLPDQLKGPVWCRIRIKPSVYGKLASILYRLPELRLRVQAESDRDSERDFRLLPGAAEAGFLISPLVESQEDLGSLWRCAGATNGSEKEDESRQVTGISCHVAGNHWPRPLFDTEIAVEFFRVGRHGDHQNFSPEELPSVAVASP